MTWPTPGAAYGFNGWFTISVSDSSSFLQLILTVPAYETAYGGSEGANNDGATCFTLAQAEALADSMAAAIVDAGGTVSDVSIGISGGGTNLVRE